MVATSGKGWRLAPSLVALMKEVDARYPRRSKAYDGSIGDAAHSARSSEHNPDRDPDDMPRGTVSAVDITKHSSAMARELLAEMIGDPRVWYVIHAGSIYSRTHNFRKLPYAGPNPHTHHLHVSLVQSAKAAADTSPWFGRPKPAPKPTERKPGSRTVKEGDRGTDVEFLQRWLGVELDVDGVFGALTETSVKRYQRMRGLNQDGIVGPLTWSHILRRDS